MQIGQGIIPAGWIWKKREKKITSFVVSSGRKIAFQRHLGFPLSLSVVVVDVVRGNSIINNDFCRGLFTSAACIDLSATDSMERKGSCAAGPRGETSGETPPPWEMIPLCKERMEMTLGSLPAPALLGRSWSGTMTIARDRR